MKRFVLAPALAALAMFFWGFLFWGLPHHLPYKSLNQVPDNAAAGEALSKIFPATGAYLIPDPRLAPEQMAELMKRGPYAQVVFRREGMEMMDPGMMLTGFVHMFVLSVLLTFLLCGLEKSFARWTCRVRFSAGIGFVVGLNSIGNAIWWHYPWSWALTHALDYLIMFTLGGLVLAKFVTPKQGVNVTNS